MINYEEIKTKLEPYKKTAAVALGFLLVFVVGFGVGEYRKNERGDALNAQSNYTTKTSKTQTNQGVQAAPITEAAVPNQDQKTDLGAVAGANTSAQADCKIKGNISAKGDKIYHVPGGAFYERTKPEQCFNTEAEAKTAGFRKSSR